MASSTEQLAAKPLCLLQELESWTVENLSIDARENVAKVALPRTARDALESQRMHTGTSGAEESDLGSAPNQVHRPRLLVCHDLQGGYGDDKWLQGGSDPSAYRIWHWRLIDVFVYFSHHLVTIPPAGWTDAAHRNGVKVLGTFITEWDAGAAICQNVLSSPQSARHIADQLVAVAMHHWFDGWLLNFENKIDPKQIPTLVEFVRYLTERMHAAHPEGEVIWYDSVTTEGGLEWQNGLTALNRPFFAASDGLFVNYTWKEGTPEACALAAKERAPAVYMGVDVFGRGTFGGGGYHADIALAAARAAGVSAAIFAPAWVIENPNEAGANFEDAQEKFWGLLQRCWPAARKTVTSLPFETDFNQGVGHSLYSDGSLVSDSPWNNLAWQSLQPLHHRARLLSAERKTTLEAGVSFEHAFNGGSSYEIRGPLEDNDYAAVRLFDCSMAIKTDQSYTVSFTVSALADCYLAPVLRIQAAAGEDVTVVCSNDGALGGSLEHVRFVESDRRNGPGKGSEEARPTRQGIPGITEQSLGQSEETTYGSSARESVPAHNRTSNTGNSPAAGDPGRYPEGVSSSLGSRSKGRAEQAEIGGQRFNKSPSSPPPQNILAGVGSHNSKKVVSVNWASLQSSSISTGGWRNFVFKIEPGVEGRLSDIGVVCHRGELPGGSSLAGVWELMDRHTEDAWVCRERAEANGHDPAIDEESSLARAADVQGLKEEDTKDSSSGDKSDFTHMNKPIKLEKEPPVRSLDLGRKALLDAARDTERSRMAVLPERQVEAHRLLIDEGQVLFSYCAHIGRIALCFD